MTKPKTLNKKLMDAAQKGNLKRIQELINEGADIENIEQSSKQTPLIAATRGGHLDTVILLLDKGANIEAKDSMGNSALYHSYAHENIANVLLNRGADINSKNNKNQSIIISCLSDSVSWYFIRVKEFIIQLLNMGALPWVPDSLGNLPQHYLAKNSYSSKTECMLSRIQLLKHFSSLPGFDVNAQNKKGETPLHFSCGSKSFNEVTTLISLGASLNIKNRMHHTPIEVYFLKYHFSVVIYLIEMNFINIYDKVTYHPVGERKNVITSTLVDSFGVLSKHTDFIWTSPEEHNESKELCKTWITNFYNKFLLLKQRKSYIAFLCDLCFVSADERPSLEVCLKVNELLPDLLEIRKEAYETYKHDDEYYFIDPSFGIYFDYTNGCSNSHINSSSSSSSSSNCESNSNGLTGTESASKTNDACIESFISNKRARTEAQDQQSQKTSYKSNCQSFVRVLGSFNMQQLIGSYL